MNEVQDRSADHLTRRCSVDSLELLVNSCYPEIMKITIPQLIDLLQGSPSRQTVYRIQSQLPGYDTTTYPTTVDDSAVDWCRARVAPMGRPKTRVEKPMPVGFEFSTHRVTMKVADEAAWKALRAFYPHGTWRRARQASTGLSFGFGGDFQGMTLGEWVDAQQGGKRTARRRFDADPR